MTRNPPPNPPQPLEDVRFEVIVQLIAELRMALGLDRDGRTTVGRAMWIAHDRARRAQRTGRPLSSFRRRRRLVAAFRRLEQQLPSLTRPDRF